VAQEGAAITQARANYADQIMGAVQAWFTEIAQPAPTLAIRYQSQVLDSSQGRDLVESFMSALGERRARDRRRRNTSVGPHLDDLVITFDGASARERASQGQHRALVLSLKLAEISHLASALGEPPMLFLDDMSSELDEGRSRQLFEAVRSLDAQVIMTSTESPERISDRLKTASNIAIYAVDGGQLTSVQL
ncbi:MAG: DNA replication and repair protein RecF, partial [Myxococcota bacterium]